MKVFLNLNIYNIVYKYVIKILFIQFVLNVLMNILKKLGNRTRTVVQGCFGIWKKMKNKNSRKSRLNFSLM